MSVGASPLLYKVLWEAAALVSCPNEDFSTVHDEWLNATTEYYLGSRRPLISNLGSGSDFTPFFQLHGITSASMSYVSSMVLKNIAELLWFERVT